MISATTVRHPLHSPFDFLGESVVALSPGQSSRVNGLATGILVANERAEEEQAHRDLVKLNNQVEGFKQFWRDAMAARFSGSSGSGSDSGSQSSGRSFTSCGDNEMTVTLDKLGETTLLRGTNTIKVTLDGHSYSITYDFEPGRSLCHAGDLTGRKVHVKFSGGVPTKARSDYDGEGEITPTGWKRL